MFYTYVLKSVNHNFLYKGHCQNLEERLIQHNSGQTESIWPYIPFTIIYTETFQTRQEAIKRERYFKSASGRRFLKNKLASQYNARPADASRTGIVYEPPKLQMQVRFPPRLQKKSSCFMLMFQKASIMIFITKVIAKI